MPSRGQSAQGIKLASSPDPNWPDFDPSGATIEYTDLAELRDMTPFAKRRNPIELTTHNDDDEQNIMGVRRNGDLEADINYLPDDETHDAETGLEGFLDDNERRIWRVTFPVTGTVWLCSGYVQEISPNAPVDGRLSARLVIKPTGHRITIAGV